MRAPIEGVCRQAAEIIGVEASGPQKSQARDRAGQRVSRPGANRVMVSGRLREELKLLQPSTNRVNIADHTGRNYDLETDRSYHSPR
jgi:hypothetical protein